MEINSIDELVKLAGLVKQQELATEAEVEEDCGCEPSQDAAITANPDMYAILQRLAQMGEVHEDEIVDEWANTPAETGEPESRVTDLPKGEPVDTSLRRYLGANGQPVKVEEAIVDHTVEDMMEAYQEYKGKAEVVTEEVTEEVAEVAEDAVEEEVTEATVDEDAVEEEITEATVDEADVEEDNAFNTAAADAKKAGKKEFSFNGKTYKVKMDAKTADALTDDINLLKQLAGL
tara:strand:+ start:5279 stop:5977 length:699 start_codon:yes stop_codon:yes gene_type:complete